MTETGKVHEVKENLVIVAPDKSAACFGCMNHECKSGSGFITAENPAGLSLKTGQTVEVAAHSASLLSQALIALLPPILGFLLGFNLSGVVFPFPTESDGASVGMGLLFFFAAAFVVYLVRKKHPASRGYKVTRIIKE
jgi:sigma-E factor negative regulatory protein RseC